MIHDVLNPQMQNCRYRGPTAKLYTDFQMPVGSALLTPVFVYGSTVIQTCF